MSWENRTVGHPNINTIKKESFYFHHRGYFAFTMEPIILRCCFNIILALSQQWRAIKCMWTRRH